MSGRNRRRTPPAAAELRQRVREILRGMLAVDADYRWLHASGYTKPHAKAGEVGDPADLLTGDPAAARHQLIRAAEAVDDAHDAVQRARASLTRIETRIDQTATPGGIDPEMPTASTSEVRRAEQAQKRRGTRSGRDASVRARRQVEKAAVVIRNARRLVEVAQSEPCGIAKDDLDALNRALAALDDEAAMVGVPWASEEITG